MRHWFYFNFYPTSALSELKPLLNFRNLKLYLFKMILAKSRYCNCLGYKSNVFLSKDYLAKYIKNVMFI